MQSLEEMRIQTIRSSAVRFADYFSTLSNKYGELAANVSESTKILNISFEIQNFVRSW
jgi:hypothetical protein